MTADPEDGAGDENKGENDAETDEKREGDVDGEAEAEEEEEEEEEEEPQDERLQWTYDIKYIKGPPKNKVRMGCHGRSFWFDSGLNNKSLDLDKR